MRIKFTIALISALLFSPSFSMAQLMQGSAAANAGTVLEQNQVLLYGSIIPRGGKGAWAGRHVLWLYSITGKKYISIEVKPKFRPASQNYFAALVPPGRYILYSYTHSGGTEKIKGLGTAAQGQELSAGGLDGPIFEFSGGAAYYIGQADMSGPRHRAADYKKEADLIMQPRLKKINLAKAEKAVPQLQ
jgi:hypothetical protein